MKYLLTILLFAVFTTPVFCQFKTIAESQPFDEPEDGFARVLLMKSGNTVFLHVNKKEGIEVKIFDSSHRQKVSKEIQPNFKGDKRKSVASVFEISHDVIIMIKQPEGNILNLYRIILDENSGNIKHEDKIAEMPPLHMGSRFATTFGHVPNPDFAIRKDPGSDFYAIAIFNSLATERNKRIEIIYYGPDNNEIARAFYNSPEDKYKYLVFLDMVVMGKDQVSVLAYAYNTVASGGKESEMVIANITPGTRDVVLDELAFSKDLVVHHGLTKYNPVSKNILLLAAAQAGSNSNEFGTVIAFINPYTKKIINGSIIYPEDINDLSVSLFGKKHGFNGIPQNLFVNADGSMVVIFEELTKFSQSGNLAITYSELGNMAVCKYDSSGKQMESYFIPKDQFVYNYNSGPFYHSERGGSACELDMGNQYKSFAYLNGKNKNYILFNDFEQNGETAKKGKITTLRIAKDCDGFYFPVDGHNIMPDRQFVFGKEERKKDHNVAMFIISDFDRERNIFCTLKLEKEGRSRQVKVVWIRP